MPISEDEYDHHPGQPQHGMSKAEQRRSNKPIMEKRRRARINHCLNELKSLILDAMKKDPARHSKLEKADILEMTVKHLQSVQRQQLAVAVATDPAVLHKFKTGFNECAGEVSRYIGRLDGVEPAVKQRLVSHLAHCVSGLQQLTPLAFTAAVQPPAAPPPQQPASAPVAGDVNNNRGAANATAPPAAGLQLIPSRLPSGEVCPSSRRHLLLRGRPPPPPRSSTGRT
ncbi:Protein deadpan, partial [Gryllus bimaculatus]